MKKSNANLTLLGLLALVVLALTSCGEADGNDPGSEYMPDMAHSIAYESNYLNAYYYNTWDSASVVDYYELAQPRANPVGTVARGYAGAYFNAQLSERERVRLAKNQPPVNEMTVPTNGSVPYYYTDTEDERARAVAEINDNPYPISAKGLAHAKDLYESLCGICHGDEGDGNGYLVREDGGKYPVQPPSFLTDTFLNSSTGRYYHAIMYGKNKMGGYADKLSYEERWQVIHYIRALQAKKNDAQYSEESNTWRPDEAMPLLLANQMAPPARDTDDEYEAEGDDDLRNNNDANDVGRSESDGTSTMQ